MLEQSDPYWKLRPPPPTPPEEICNCTGRSPILLQPCLTANPIACLLCNLEVPPERIGFSAELADKLARWQGFYDAFYRLWLDSDEFEAWAQTQLENPKSPVNQQGLALVSALNAFRRTYYGWFQAEAEDESPPPTHCPVCQAQLSQYAASRARLKMQRLVCERCSIAMPNG
jgi:hypothetical protein